MYFSKRFSVIGAALTAATLASALSGCADDKVNNGAVANKSAVASLQVANANNFPLVQEPLSVSFYDLGINAEQAKALRVLTGDKVIASQLIDTNADGSADSLFIAPDFGAGQAQTFSLVEDAKLALPAAKKQTQAEISIKEGGSWNGKKYEGGTFKNVDRVTPPPQYTDHSFWIRYEGPGIESDQVAYRVYLDWRNGFDIFGKKTTDVALQNVGLDGYDSYHLAAPWGQDVLKVGLSLGVGGFGFWNGKEVELASKMDSREAVITNNGDLYSSFLINYNGWEINQQKLNLKAQFSMTAGSRLVHVQLNADQQLPNFAIGLVKHPGVEILQGNDDVTGQAWTYVASWGKQSLSSADDNLGMAVIFKRGDRQEQTQDEHSYVSVMNDNGGDLDYYFLAVWDKDVGGITTKEQFKAYLDREVERLTKAPRVQLHTATTEAETKKH